MEKRVEEVENKIKIDPIDKLNFIYINLNWIFAKTCFIDQLKIEKTFTFNWKWKSCSDTIKYNYIYKICFEVEVVLEKDSIQHLKAKSPSSLWKSMLVL